MENMLPAAMETPITVWPHDVAPDGHVQPEVALQAVPRCPLSGRVTCESSVCPACPATRAAAAPWPCSARWSPAESSGTEGSRQSWLSAGPRTAGQFPEGERKTQETAKKTSLCVLHRSIGWCIDLVNRHEWSQNLSLLRNTEHRLVRREGKNKDLAPTAHTWIQKLHLLNIWNSFLHKAQHILEKYNLRATW